MATSLNNSNNQPISNAPPSAPYDPEQALMDALKNPNLYKSGAVTGLLMQVAGLVSDKELKIRQEDSQMRAQASKAQTQATQAQGNAITAGALSQTVASAASGATSIGSAVKGTAHFKELHADSAAHETKLAALNGKIDSHEHPDAQVGEASNPAERESKVNGLKADKAKLERNYKLKHEEKSGKHENQMQIHTAASSLNNALGSVGQAQSQASKALAENTSQLEGQVVNDIQSNEKTATDTATQALQILTVAGDLAKASVGR